MIKLPGDLTHVVDLTHAKGTGPQRSRRPVYVELQPPCNDACPAGEDTRGWLELAQAGRYRDAWDRLVRASPFPAVLGRVCYRPCESSCNRCSLDEPVSIHAIERFLGDLAVTEAWPLPRNAPSTGRRVLIVGAGPSGLSAATQLARLGHDVEVHEGGPVAGGMMRFGIPSFRLPRTTLDAEIARIEQQGVRIVLSRPVADVLQEKREGRFDAVFLAVGAHVSRHTAIPARDAARVLDALPFLQQAGEGHAPRLGRRVAVYGGGNTAMDVARTARRAGAEETVIIYHRDRAHMSANALEMAEAVAEGVHVRWLSSIRSFEGDSITVEEMELDAAGLPQPTGRFETLGADALVLALGQTTDSAFLKDVSGLERRPDGAVVVASDFATGHPGVFAGGDMVPSGRSVSIAIGHGRQAAKHIDAWLKGTPVKVPKVVARVRFDMLNPALLSDVDSARESERPPGERVGDFAEVFGDLTADDARREAQRCLSCGRCYKCDNCFAACPKDAVIKLGPGRAYRIDLSQCDGCATCVEQCPCHAMEMLPESPEVLP